jgi:hypothetical protein
MCAHDPKLTFRILILTWIKFRVVTHELSSNDELAFCETGACHSRALLTSGRLPMVRGT